MTTAACGRIGSRFTGRPVAARTADAIAAGDVTTGTALTGFAPNGATTSRSSTSFTILMSGASSAVGSAYPVRSGWRISPRGVRRFSVSAMPTPCVTPPSIRAANCAGLSTRPTS